MKYGKEYFVSGIDTDCGKTYITGHLAFHLHKNGIPVITTKLIQTGCNGISEDIITHRGIMEIGLLEEDKSKKTCPYIFPFPASPHLASELEDTKLNISLFRKNTDLFLNEYRVVLSEGAGGLMVPLSRNLLTIEYIQKYKLPLILVCSSKLGSINHTLLSVSACKQYGINLTAIIYNQLPNSNKIIANDSINIIKDYLSKNFSSCYLIDGNDLEKTADSGTEIAEMLLN